MHSNRKSQASRGPTSEIFGVNPVIEALRAGRRPLRASTSASGADDARRRDMIEVARAQGGPVHQAPRMTLDKRAGNGTHQGVVARVAAAHYADSEDLIETIAERVGMNPEPLALILDG